jgi:hypothetical protein
MHLVSLAPSPALAGASWPARAETPSQAPPAEAEVPSAYLTGYHSPEYIHIPFGAHYDQMQLERRAGLGSGA